MPEVMVMVVQIGDVSAPSPFNFIFSLHLKLVSLFTPAIVWVIFWSTYSNFSYYYVMLFRIYKISFNFLNFYLYISWATPSLRGSLEKSIRLVLTLYVTDIHNSSILLQSSAQHYCNYTIILT